MLCTQLTRVQSQHPIPQGPPSLPGVIPACCWVWPPNQKRTKKIKATGKLWLCSFLQGGRWGHPAEASPHTMKGGVGSGLFSALRDGGRVGQNETCIGLGNPTVSSGGVEVDLVPPGLHKAKTGQSLWPAPPEDQQGPSSVPKGSLPVLPPNPSQGFLHHPTLDP